MAIDLGSQVNLDHVWNEKDLERAINSIEIRIKRLAEAAKAAMAPTVPTTYLKISMQESLVLLPCVYWPMSRDLDGLFILGEAYALDAVDASKLVKTVCEGKPGWLHRFITGLEHAIEICENIKKRRAEEAQQIVNQSVDKIRELHTRFVAEELKDANK